MKVGVDGILIGSWANLDSTRCILDIGAGTGLIALMLAQRSTTTEITGIEIDGEACIQAKENVSNSPWPNRISIHNISYQEYCWPHPYDLVISNPPFFQTSNSSDSRAIARQQLYLSPLEIIQTISPRLTPRGKLALIVPYEQADGLIKIALSYQLFLTRRTNIRPTPSSVLKRSLLEFSRQSMPLTENEITLEIARHQYTPEYQHLIQDFFLRFSRNPQTSPNKS